MIKFYVWLPLPREVLGNMCVVIVYFFLMTKKSREKFKYLENEKSF